MKKWLHRFSKLPGFSLLPAAIWFFVVLIGNSDTGTPMEIFLVEFVGAIVLGLGWGIRLALFLASRKSTVGSLRLELSEMLRWSIEPAVLIIAFLLSQTSVPFAVRFSISRPALDAYVRQVQKGQIQPVFDQNQRVGLFRVRETEVIQSNVVRLITTDCGFDDCGLVYSPDGSPPVIGEDIYFCLSGSWWRWRRSW